MRALAGIMEGGESSPSEGDAKPLESAEQACVKDAKFDPGLLDECAVWCWVCEMWLNGTAQWQDHKIGKKHRKNIGMLPEKNLENHRS